MNITTLRYEGQWANGSLPAVQPDNVALFVFGAPEFGYESGPINDLVTAYPNAAIVGCSTAGEIFGTEISDNSLSVAIVEFEKTEVRTASSPVSSPDDSFDAGVRIAQDLAADDLRAIVILSDGLTVNGSELVRGVNEVREDHVVVTGGLAADGDRFERTWTIVDGAPRSNWVSALGLYGTAVSVGHGSKGGWDLFGPERRVTRSAGNILYELDGKPALDLYKEYLGELADGLPANGLLFPLAMRSASDQHQVVRTILAVDEHENSLTFAGDVPEGYGAQLMQANFDRLVGGAEVAARHAADQARNGDCLAIAISCVGRRLVLGERTEEEIEATLDALPLGAQQVGFYSYGEISPYAPGTCELHNQTMTLTTIAEM